MNRCEFMYGTCDVGLFQGEDDEWHLHWRHLCLNPFSPDRTPLASPPSETVHKAKYTGTTTAGNPSPPASHPDTATNQLKRSIELTTLLPLPELVEDVTRHCPSRSLPSFLTPKYLLNVWRADLSYVVTRNLDILIMVHVPVAKLESFRHLYKYVRKPLAFSKTATYFFPNPPNKYFMPDKDNSHP